MTFTFTPNPESVQAAEDAAYDEEGNEPDFGAAITAYMEAEYAAGRAREAEAFEDRNNSWEANTGWRPHHHDYFPVLILRLPDTTMTSPLIDAPGDYLTRDGRRVRIIAIAEGWAMGWHEDQDPSQIDDASPRDWRTTGEAYGWGKPYDIISKAPPPAPKKIRGWAWVWDDGRFYDDRSVNQQIVGEARRVYMIETDPPEGQT